jgi:L-fucose isomerase-like protein
MDVFVQYGLKFTALKPHTARPNSEHFARNVDHFDRLCRVVGGVRGMTVGAIGARTTPFKTVRIDELALQRHGITVETVDMAEVIAGVRETADDDPAVAAKSAELAAHTQWGSTPPPAFATIVKLGVVLDRLIEEMGLDALAIRCWLELQKQLGISPCVLLSALNDRFVAAACEVDVGNAVAMRALSQASGHAAACLDWNNNYGDDEEQCILFHCGPVPQSLMAGLGCVTDHYILANVTGQGCGWGCNQGRIVPMPVTVAGLMTDAGKLRFYVGEGRITDDEIPPEFFGCAGVFEHVGLQDALLTIGKQGHRHHVSLTRGHVQAPLVEALRDYLGCEVTVL